MKTVFTLLLSIFLLPALPAQQLLWTTDLSEAQASTISACKKDSGGNTYVLGQFNPSVYTPLPNSTRQAGDLFIVKLNSSGTMLWKKRFRGSASGFDITIDSKDNVAITGGFIGKLTIESDILSGPSATPSCFVAKLTKDGEKIWTTNAGGGIGTGITHDLQDNIYVVGLNTPVTSQLNKYNAEGALILTKMLNVRTLADVVVDSDANIYITGTCSPRSSIDNVVITTPPNNIGYISFLVKLSASAAMQWFQVKNYISFDYSSSLALTGNAIYWYGPEGGIGIFSKKVWKYNLDGSLVSSSIVSTALILSESNSITAAGDKVCLLNYQFNKLSLHQYNSNLALENTTLINSAFTKTYALTSLGSSISVASSYSRPNGTITSEVSGFGNANAKESSIETDASLLSNNQRDEDKKLVTISPNPIQGKELSIHSYTKNATLVSVIIRDDVQKIQEYTIKFAQGIETHVLEICPLPAGVYTIQLCMDKKCLTERLLVK